jgi:hypothetical protein
LKLFTHIVFAKKANSVTAANNAAILMVGFRMMFNFNLKIIVAAGQI